MPFKVGNTYGKVNKGRVWTEEQQIDISEILKEKYRNLEFKKSHGFQKGHKFLGDLTKPNFFQKGHIPWNEGKKTRIEPINKKPREKRLCEFCGKKFEISIVSKQKFCSRKCASFSQKGKSAWNKGKPRTWNSPTEFKKGHLPWTKGKKGYTNKGSFRKGEKHRFWNGGSSFEPYSSKFEEIKPIILERDNYKCQICNKTQTEEILEIGYSLNVHHIDYNKKNNVSDNLITLCRVCHAQTNFSRSKWMRRLKSLITKKSVESTLKTCEETK